MWKPDVNLATTAGSAKWNYAGLKFFELSNHLGNVNVVINDVRTLASGMYSPTVINSNDYYAFGGQMNDRTFTNAGASAYRYGFNGKENDNEVKGEGNQQDYGMRIYDPRIAKFLSVDPITIGFPMLTPYQFASNSPIANVDLDGEESKYYTLILYKTIDDKGQIIKANSRLIEAKSKAAGWHFDKYDFLPHYEFTGRLGEGKLYNIFSSTSDQNPKFLGSLFVPDPKKRIGEKKSFSYSSYVLWKWIRSRWK